MQLHVSVFRVSSTHTHTLYSTVGGMQLHVSVFRVSSTHSYTVYTTVRGMQLHVSVFRVSSTHLYTVYNCTGYTTSCICVQSFFHPLIHCIQLYGVCNFMYLCSEFLPPTHTLYIINCTGYATSCICVQSFFHAKAHVHTQTHLHSTCM